MTTTMMLITTIVIAMTTTTMMMMMLEEKNGREKIAGALTFVSPIVSPRVFVSQDRRASPTKGSSVIVSGSNLAHLAATPLWNPRNFPQQTER